MRFFSVATANTYVSPMPPADQTGQGILGRGVNRKSDMDGSHQEKDSLRAGTLSPLELIFIVSEVVCGCPLCAPEVATLLFRFLGLFG